MFRSLPILALLTLSAPALPAQKAELLRAEVIESSDVWIDPAIKASGKDQFRVSVWFENQFLGDGEAYLRRTKEFADIGRRALREKVIKTLKSLSKESETAARDHLGALTKDGKISDVEFHWIVNGFSCQTKLGALDELAETPGVSMIYFAGPTRGRIAIPKPSPPADLTEGNPESVPFDPDQFESPWYIESLKVEEVWKEHKVTGKGVLNVVHDGNFVLSPGVLPTLYKNPDEEPNGKDDSESGLVDDLHGFDFLLNRPVLTRTPMPKSGRVNSSVLHGHQCAAIICGRGTKASPHQVGIAPESAWAGVLAGRKIEDAIEWAIEQGADTYSMSFSAPNLGEYRSHWRKIMEHGAFCGVHFVSGAGNFAVKGSPKFAPVPVQMRTPEDIPQVVFAAAGVQQDLSRTPFSSQGPVLWETEHYRDGRVDKPEVVAFNFKLPLLLPSGKMIPKVANGNSFAGPMFCGVIALMLSANPDLKPWEVREIIIATARDVADEGFDHQTGHGLIDAHAAVAEAIRRKK